MNRLIKTISIIAATVLALCTPVYKAQAQNVSEPTFHQEGDKVAVTFHLSSKADVSLYVSTDGGRTFKGPLKHVTGDAGLNVSPGQCRIVWDPIAEYGGISGDNVCFKIKAERSRNSTTAGSGGRAGSSDKKKDRFIRFGLGMGSSIFIVPENISRNDSDGYFTFDIPVEILLGRSSQLLNVGVSETVSFFKNTIRFTTLASLRFNLKDIVSRGNIYLGVGVGFNANIYTNSDTFLDLDDYAPFFSDDFDDFDDFNGSGTYIPDNTLKATVITACIQATYGVWAGPVNIEVFYRYDFYPSVLNIGGNLGLSVKYFF